MRPELLVIADDLTGALDTSVHFAKRALKTRLVVEYDHLFDSALNGVDVYVVCSDTRHLPPEKAYDVVYELTKRAIKAGIPRILKKTDSALRGNIGSELEAVLRASGSVCLPFLPAYPRIGRTTKHGVQYIDDVPVHQSVFSRDAFEPVLDSYIPSIIGQQSNVEVRTSDAAEEPWRFTLPKTQGIVVFDAEADGQIDRTVAMLKRENGVTVFAGCAGCAIALANQLWPANGETHDVRMFQRKELFVVSGSLNPITNRQIEFARRNQVGGICLSEDFAVGDGNLERMERRVCGEIDRNGICMVWPKTPEREISDAERCRFASKLGFLTEAVIREHPGINVFVIGGDTLKEVLRHLNCQYIQPLYEIVPGTVLSRLEVQGQEMTIISKSGGFGTEEIILDVFGHIRNDAVRAQVP